MERLFLEGVHAQNLVHGVETQAEVELFFEDGDQDVHTHRVPDLGFDGVHRIAPKAAQVEMALDPFEEEFDLPAALIEIGDGLGGQVKVVG